MLGCYLGASKSAGGVFYRQASPSLFPEQQQERSPESKHMCAKSLEVQPQNWHSITFLLPVLLTKSQRQPDATAGEMNSTS